MKSLSDITDNDEINMTGLSLSDVRANAYKYSTDRLKIVLKSKHEQLAI